MQQIWSGKDDYPHADPLGGARLANLVLGLIWRFRRRPERDINERHEPYFVSELADYLRATEEKPSQVVEYLKLVEKDMEEVVWVALRCVADGPDGWILGSEATGKDTDTGSAAGDETASTGAKDAAENSPIWHDLRGKVDALAYDLWDDVNVLIQAAHVQVDQPSRDWLLLVGRFIEQAPFRRRALDYYELLLKAAQICQWTDRQMEQIRSRLRHCGEQYRRWRASQNAIEILSGKKQETTWLSIRHHGEYCDIFFKPGEHRVRFHSPRAGADSPDCKCDSELQMTGLQASKDRIHWEIRYGDKVVMLTWDREHAILFIEADQKFRLRFSKGR